MNHYILKFLSGDMKTYTLVVYAEYGALAIQIGLKRLELLRPDVRDVIVTDCTLKKSEDEYAMTREEIKNFLHKTL